MNRQRSIRYRSMRNVRVSVPVKTLVLVGALVAVTTPVAAALAPPATTAPASTAPASTASGGTAPGDVAPGIAAAGLSATFRQQSTWPNGYTATYTVANATGASVTGWAVEFDLPSGTT